MDEYQKMSHMMDKFGKRWNIFLSSRYPFPDFLSRFKHEASEIFDHFYDDLGYELSEEFFRKSSLILATNSIIAIDEIKLCKTKSINEFIQLLYAFLIPIFTFMDKVEAKHSRQEITEAINELEKFDNSIETISDKYPEDIISYLSCVSVNYDLYRVINNVLIFSNELNIRVTLQKNRLQLLPEGAKLLDEQIVNQDLTWLAEHPLSLDYYQKSLQSYLMKAQDYVRNTLDNLRYSLEQLLKDILNNKKSLENNKNEILSWLTNEGIHVQIRNMVATLLSRYCEYMNDVKHGEDYSADDVEFMIYQTGIFMRLLLQIEIREKTT